MEYIDKAINSLNDICVECIHYGTEQCVKRKCNIGFSLTMLEKIKTSPLILEGGISLIPCEDVKYYDENKIARSIASICKLCKECNEHHNESCIISLARKSIEVMVLNDSEIYPGNIFTYLVNVEKHNPEFSSLVMEEYQKLSY